MSKFRNNQERNLFLMGQVAQAVGDYLVCLARYEEAREEYQHAQTFYHKIIPSSSNFHQAQENQKVILQQLEKLPKSQKSSADYQLDLLFDTQQVSENKGFNLSQWLENIFSEGWQKIETFLELDSGQLAYGLRSLDVEIKPEEKLDNTTRSYPNQEIKSIFKQLQARGLEIPSEAIGAYQELNLAQYPLRFYVFTWVDLPQLEWALLIIVGAVEQSFLPKGLHLKIHDLTTLLGEQIVDNCSQNYVYTKVVGKWDEQFSVTLSLENQESLSLPPFKFINF